MITDVLLLIFLAFFFGGIPTGYIIARLYGIDIRKHGSGNIGATNLKRVIGSKAGIYTFIGDLLKGAIPVFFFPLLGSGFGMTSSMDLSPSFGAAAVFGHCFSPFLKFKGGKGVATGFGVYLILAPIPALLAIGGFGVMLRVFKFVSLASVAAVLIFIAILGYLSAYQKVSVEVFLSAIVVGCLIIIKHRANIGRLLNGTEPKISDKEK